jgi:polysaccharide export outer membrane protein
MRAIEIRRHDQIVATLDLYDYLLRGVKRDDIRLETGDVIFVALRGKRAQVTGAVLRPAIYELKPEETLPDLLRAAGGFAPDAALQRVAVYRIVPVPERGSGPFPRSVVSVSLPVIARAGDDPPPAPPGAGVFGPVFVPGLTVEDGDSVVVDSIPARSESYYVSVTGAVRRPGQYPWREGMTLRELMTEARGPDVGAYLKEAEIARMPADRSGGELAQTIHVPLDSTYLTARDSAGRFVGPPGQGFPASGAPEVPLEPYDNVLILKQPDFSLLSTVYVGGEVRYPGTYALLSGQDRLTDIVDRAGGLTPIAFRDGIRFYRTADHVGRIDVDFPRAEKLHTSRYNLVLQDGDSIYVPEYQPSVKVSGAVHAPGSVMWQQGRDLEFYVNAAGGATYKADMSGVSIHYANGEVRTRNTTALVFHADPQPAPGAEIVVPSGDPTVHKPDLITTLGVIAQVISSLVTLAVVSKL